MISFRICVISLLCSSFCIAYECGYPGSPLFGNFEPQRSPGFLYQEGEIITYSCESGFGLMYNPRKGYNRTCQCNGQWSGSIPTCLKDLSYGLALETQLMEIERLPIRKSPRNPKCTLDKNIPKSRDFRMYSRQSNTSECLNSTCKMPIITHLRFFLDNPSVFKGQASDPVSVSVLQNDTNGGKPCEIIPREGGFLAECRSNIESTVAIIRITLKDGVWMDICDWEAFNTEEIRCGYPEVPAHSVMSTIEGTSFTFQCEEGYELHGDPVQKCVPTNPYTPFPYSLSTSCVPESMPLPESQHLKFETFNTIAFYSALPIVGTLLIVGIVCLISHRRRHLQYSNGETIKMTNGSMVLNFNKPSKLSPLQNNLRTVDCDGYEIPDEVITETLKGNGAIHTNSEPPRTTCKKHNDCTDLLLT